MDELMARFVTNMERNDCKDRYRHESKPLYSESLECLGNIEIEESVKKSLSALKDLLSHNTIHMERQPNSENNLYLKLMERAQEENKLNLINVLSSKLYHFIKTRKPAHLRWNLFALI